MAPRYSNTADDSICGRLAAALGFEPRECWSQSPVPYHLAKPQNETMRDFGWDRWIRTTGMTESKSAALPLGYIPPIIDSVSHSFYIIAGCKEKCKPFLQIFLAFFFEDFILSGRLRQYLSLPDRKHNHLGKRGSFSRKNISFLSAASPSTRTAH